jgi:hypothetical protein
MDGRTDGQRSDPYMLPLLRRGDTKKEEINKLMTFEYFNFHPFATLRGQEISVT